MKVTYEVRFDDENRARKRSFADRHEARWWASRNRPTVGYHIVPQYQNALHAAIAYVLRRREPTTANTALSPSETHRAAQEAQSPAIAPPRFSHAHTGRRRTRLGSPQQ